MNTDKQAVEEMAKVIKSSLDGLGCGNFNFTGDEISIMFAKALYNAGYRRQSEPISCGHEKGGEWVQLPCKVGDTMYVKYDGVVFPVVVKAIRLDTKKNSNRICVTGTIHLYEDYSHNYKATFPFNSIGKSLFYTEAEAKMKGGV